MPVVGRGSAAARAVHLRHWKNAGAGERPSSAAVQLSSRITTTAGKRNPCTPCITPVREAFRPFWRYQWKAQTLYQRQHVQYAIAFLISLNFLANIVESQIDPFSTLHAAVWQCIEDVFNIIFLIELLINMYAHWFVRFWASGWNIFDVVVVAVGMVSLARVDLPGALSLLRMLRAFRVFRLFKRIKSLNRIVVSLVAAVPGIANASFIMLLVMCIYAILGVEFYGSFGESGAYNNSDGARVDSISDRQMMYGEEYFGTFSSALFTMFQVLTGESWAEAVARPLIFQEDVLFRVGSAAFFVSFILINSIVLINVVVAVLLEKCIEPPDVNAVGMSVDPYSERFAHDVYLMEAPMPDIREPQFARKDSVRLLPKEDVPAHASSGGRPSKPQVSGTGKPQVTFGPCVAGGKQQVLPQYENGESPPGDELGDDEKSRGEGASTERTPRAPPTREQVDRLAANAHLLDALMDEVGLMREQIPLLLLAVQSQARQLKRMKENVVMRSEQ